MYFDASGNMIFAVSQCSSIFDIGCELYQWRAIGGGVSDLYFDWLDVGFAGLSTLTTLVALQLKIRSAGYGVHVNRARSKDVDRYVSRMNYYRQIGIKRDEDFIRHNEGDRFLPIEKFSSTDSRSDLPERVSKTIIAHTPLSSNLKASVDYMFGEIMDNVCVHSRSAIGGFIGAQFYPQKHKLELCIVDGGCGIPASLRRNAFFAHMTDDDLLPKALEYGIGENVSGVRCTQGYGKGKGLSFISNMVSRSGGVMYIISGEAGVSVKEGSVTPISRVYFPGTAVSLEIPTNIGREVSATEMFSGMEGSALLDELLDKYGTGNDSNETVTNILW